MIALRIHKIGAFFYRLNLPRVAKLFEYINRVLFACYIPSAFKYGNKLTLGYNGLGIVFHPRATVGDNCHVSQNVTIGGTSKKYDVPQIGDDVYIGAGAKIIGPVRVGNNVVIGANAVVITNIDDNSLVVGVPARVVKTGIFKKDYVS